MKPRQLTKRINSLLGNLSDQVQTETRIDYNSFNESERELFDKVQGIIEKYGPANPPQDVIEKNAALWYKGLEVFGRRATELFVNVVPA